MSRLLIGRRAGAGLLCKLRRWRAFGRGRQVAGGRWSLLNKSTNQKRAFLVGLSESYHEGGSDDDW